MLSAGQVDLLRCTHALLQPHAVRAAAIFYDKLHERDPHAAALCGGDMAADGERLMATIAAAVQRLGEAHAPQRLAHEVSVPGAGRGAHEPPCATFGGALLDTLALVLGPRFTPAARQAWARLYALCASEMRRAALPHHAARRVSATLAQGGKRAM